MFLNTRIFILVEGKKKLFHVKLQAYLSYLKSLTSHYKNDLIETMHLLFNVIYSAYTREYIFTI